MPRETLESLSQAEERLERDGFTHMLLALLAPDGSRGLLAVNYGANVPFATTIRQLGTSVIGTKYAVASAEVVPT